MKKNGKLKIDPDEDKKAEITNECFRQINHYTATRAPTTIKKWGEEIRAMVRDAVNAAFEAGRKSKR